LRTVSSTFVLIAIGALPSISACSGGSSGTPAQANAELSNGRLVLAIPAAAKAGGSQRMFLSPSTVSVSVAVTGIAIPVVADVSASSNRCVTSDETRTCTIPIAAPAGGDTFTATLFSAANATGTVLGIGTTTQSIAPGAPFSLTVAVKGVVASIGLAATQKQFTSGIAASTNLIVSALDPGGNTIVGAYESPITLTDSDQTGTFTVTPTSVSDSTTTVTLTYSGGSGATSATISADGTNVPVTSLSTQVITVVPAAPFTVSPASLTLLGDGVTATLSIADPTAYTGPYTVAVADPAVASESIAGKTITVTAAGAGSTRLTVSAPGGRSVTVPITVTTTTLPIQ